ncbi:cytochrome c oxidase assembly protein [Kitasatospora sp. GAS204B]|uniref:cytochrome c oxidase assembly protein n=1 Tax=unclassified Kitasatospora TaxID=2633591 RepID=UPI0024739CBC|nr:cytochrome c oxidase assembly protein [Kitasatospora sp. GAS204B]MDH6117143.1 cytochrome c oxidase assembly factor CtaG [Kitasatospora sp. GAS204B]
MQSTAVLAEAAGYHGPPPWQWADLATSWTAEPVVLALCALLGGGYLLGLRTLARAGQRWQPTRTLNFFGGLLLWIWVTCSGIGVYDRILFTDRAVQVVLLLMLVPLLIAMGAPVSLLAEASPPDRRERILRALRSGPSKVLMFPAVSTVLLLAPPWLLYFTPWYEKSLSSGAWNIGLHVSLVLLGLAYFWPRLQLDPVGHEYPHLIGLVITFVEVIFDAALGIVLIYGGHIVAEHYYVTLDRPWGPSIAQDQTWGGNALWVLGDLVGLPFLCALIRRMIVQGREETAAVDAVLDAQYAAAAEAAQAAGAEGGEGGEAEPAEVGLRPWWLDDPNLKHRFGADG